MKTQSTPGGFTLIELLSVMAIMTVVLAIAVASSLDWGRGTGLRGSARNLKSSLSLAREWAMTRGAATTVLWSNQAASDRGWFAVTNAADGLFGSTNFLARGVGFGADGLSRVCFLPDGSCAGDDAQWPEASADIVLRELTRGDAGLAVTLKVFRVTGCVRIEP